MVQVLFTGEQIGIGMGRTKVDAQQQAAENALHRLAGKISFLLYYGFSSDSIFFICFYFMDLNFYGLEILAAPSRI